MTEPTLLQQARAQMQLALHSPPSPIGKVVHGLAAVSLILQHLEQREAAIARYLPPRGPAIAPGEMRCPACGDAFAIGHGRECDERPPAQVPSDVQPHTVDMHKFTLRPGQNVRLPDGRHVQNMSNTVIWLDVADGAVRAGVDAPADDLDLDALQKLCDNATPGPWKFADGYAWVSVDRVDEDETHEVCEFRDVSDASRGDAHFIAAARDALPKLIAEVRRLRTACERMEREPFGRDDA